MKRQLRISFSWIRIFLVSNLALLLWSTIPSGAQEYGNITPPPPRPRRAYSTVDNYWRMHDGGASRTYEAPTKHRRAYTTGNSYVSAPHSTKHRRADTDRWERFRSAEGTAKSPRHQTQGVSLEKHELRKVQQQPERSRKSSASEKELKQPLPSGNSEETSGDYGESNLPVKHESSYELSDEVLGSLTTTTSGAKFKSIPRKRLSPPDEKKAFDIPPGRLGAIPSTQMPFPPTSLGGFELTSSPQGR